MSSSFGGGGFSLGGQNSFLPTAASAGGQSLASSANPAPSFLNPATATSTMNSGAGLFSVGPAGAAETQDMLYKQLTAPTREIVDSDFKAPTRNGLLELERHLGQAWADRMAGLAQIRVRALGVETRQQQLLQALRPNLEQARQLAREARACRAMGGGLQQIRASSSSAGRPSRVPDEALPAPFYKHVEQTLERRLQQVNEALRHLQRLELARRQGHGNGQGQRVDLTCSDLRGSEEAEPQEALYGQAHRIGAKQLLELLQRQNDAFMRVAALAAEAHNATADAKARLLRDRKPGQDPDPFSTADRKEQAERRVQQQKMRSECSKFVNAQTSSISSTAQSSSQQALTGALQTQPAGAALGFGATLGGSGITSSLPLTAASTSTPASGFGSGLGFSTGATGLGSAAGSSGSGFGFGPTSAGFSTGAAAGTAFGGGAGSGGFGSGTATGTGFGSGFSAATGFGSSLGLTSLSQPQQQQQFGVGNNSLDLGRLAAPTASSVAGKRNKNKK